MSGNTQSGVPQFSVPPIDPKTGQWNRQWWLFLQSIFDRTGGVSGETDAAAESLMRNRSDNAGMVAKAQESNAQLPRRTKQPKPVDERVPQRHALPKLVLTKESYKPLTFIRIYRGLTADIPAGWGLADGTAGRPDLRDKFVVGSGNLYVTDATGGSTTIIANNLPTHTHPYNDLNTTYAATTVAVQSGAGTTVVQSIAATPVDTPRTSGNNTTTATAYLPPYYALAYIINTQTVTIVTDAKLR
jgi:microcystin-dependent protein